MLLRRSRIKLFLISAALLFSASRLSAQKEEPPIKLSTDLVLVNVTVTDVDGNYIRKLGQGDFVIYDDGAPQKIDFFESDEQSEITKPLALVFAIDTSGSIEPEEISRQYTAAMSFMRLVRPGSLFSVITFNYQIRVLQDFTNDPLKIGHAFQRLGKVEGSTRLFGSIDKGVSMLKNAPRYLGGRRLRRVIVVVTDGMDSVDPIDQSRLIEKANAAEVTVYSLTLPSYAPGWGPSQRVMTLLDVSRVVPLTGGKDFSADISDFLPIFPIIVSVPLVMLILGREIFT